MKDINWIEIAIAICIVIGVGSCMWENAKLGEGCQVWQFASVIRGAELGENVTVASCAIVDGIPASDSLTYTPERLVRFSNGEQPDDSTSMDDSMQSVEVFECYLRADMDGDGIAELRQVFYAGNEILSDEECDYVPFHSICPIPIPHKFFGQSLADRTTDIQLQKTTITRQILDNLYLTNNARVTAVDGQVNLDDLLTATAGGVVRIKSQGAVQPLNVPPVAGQAFPMLQYLDSVAQKRTGVTDASQGLDPAILQNVTAAAVASMRQ